MKRALAWVREHSAEYGGDPASSRSPAAPRAATSRRSPRSRRRPGVPARLRGRRHHASRLRAALRRLRLRRRDRPTSARRCATASWAAGPAAAPARRPRGVRARLAAAAASAPTRRRSCHPRPPRHAWSPVEQARRFVARLRGVSREPSPTPSCPGPSTPSTCSRRSGVRHVVRGVDRFLHGSPTTSGRHEPGARDARRPPRHARTPRRASCPRTRGCCCTTRGAARSPHGPVLEIGTYCGKSAIYLGAAARAAGGTVFTVDHHRGSEENQPGWEHHDPALVDPEFGRMDTLPTSGARSRPPGSRTRSSRSSAAPRRSPRSGAPRCRWCSSTAGTPRCTPSNDYTGWAPGWSPGGLLVIHDVFPDPADGGRPPYRRLPAGAGPATSRRSTVAAARCGCYAGRGQPPARRPSADRSGAGHPHSSAAPERAAACWPRGRCPSPGWSRDRASTARTTAAAVYVVCSAGQLTSVGEDVAGPVGAVLVRAGAACRASSRSGPLAVAERRRGRAPARTSPRRSPTGSCRRSGCRARAPRSRPTGCPASARAGVAADRAAEHRVVPVHRERRLVQEQVAVLAQRVAEPAGGQLPLRLRVVHQLGRARRPARSAWKMLELPASSASSLTPGRRPPATRRSRRTAAGGRPRSPAPVARPASSAARTPRRGGPASGARRRPRGRRDMLVSPLASSTAPATSFIGQEPSSRWVARHQS